MFWGGGVFSAHFNSGRRLQPLLPFGSWAKNTRGAAAIEFAMIGLPLFLMIGAIMEMALVFLISISLEDAASDLARKIRVGTYIAPGVSATTSSGSNLDLTDFKTAICNDIKLVPIGNCTSQLQVDIRPMTGLSSWTTISPISNGTFNTSVLCYYSGGAGSIVQMRIYYVWPLLTPFLLSGLQNISTYNGASGTWAAVSATEFFVNEQNSAISNTGNGC